MHRQQLQQPARKPEPQPPQLLLRSCVLQQLLLLLLQEAQVRQLLLQDAPVLRQRQLLQAAQILPQQLQLLLHFHFRTTVHPGRSSGAALCWTYVAAKWCHTRRS
jgi:hypothetical protein